MIRRHTSQTGQAATEFVIAGAFFLVPLFLIIPLLGKYIDIHQMAIQQARFETWEYTAWFGPNTTVMTNIKKNQRADRKTYLRCRQEGVNIFFSNPRAADYGQPEMTWSPNPLWIDHRGDSLLPAPQTPISGGAIRERSTPDPTAGLFDDILEGLSWMLKYYGKALHGFGVDAEFDAINPHGYFTSTVRVRVRSLDEILPRQNPADRSSPAITDHPLTFTAHSAVLTNPWNAGSRENALTETRGMVFTSLLNPISTKLNKWSSKLNHLADDFSFLGFKITLPGFPDFGYVRDDMIPLEHLNENHKKVTEVKTGDRHLGLYYYEEQD